MHRCAIKSVHPYALMIAPTYIHLRLNQKLLSVKGPLDFFTPEELKRLEGYGEFHFPRFVEVAMPFREAGLSLKGVLAWDPSASRGSDLPPAPYEVSDATLRIIAPLWGMNDSTELGIEPFFVAVTVNELCEVLPGELLVRARDQSVEDFECAVLISSWAVMAALILGYHDLNYLNQLRAEAFQWVVSGQAPASLPVDLNELIHFAEETYRPDRLRLSEIAGSGSRMALKLASRLRRIQTELAEPREKLASIEGAEGFIHG